MFFVALTERKPGTKPLPDRLTGYKKEVVIMMEKKRMAALLAAVLFGMSAIPAGAVNLIDTDTAATDSAEHAELDLYGVRATVTDRQDGRADRQH